MSNKKERVIVVIDEIDNGFVVESENQKYTYGNLPDLIEELPGIFSVELQDESYQKGEI